MRKIRGVHGLLSDLILFVGPLFFVWLFFEILPMLADFIGLILVLLLLYTAFAAMWRYVIGRFIGFEDYLS